uniref:Uncharacterized protein n=1 Tax=Avena sativa TaxID=4498 RepID=A0ACD5WIS7_AVESA
MYVPLRARLLYKRLSTPHPREPSGLRKTTVAPSLSLTLRARSTSRVNMDMEHMHARRLLSHAAAAAAATPAVASTTPGPSGAPRSTTPFGSADDTVITILSLLLCVLVVALVLRGFVRCAFRVTRRVCYGQEEEPPGGLGGDVEAAAGGVQVQMAALQAMAAGAVAVAATSSKKKGKGKGAAIRSIPTVEYSAEIELAVCGSTECAICLAEFARGERVRVLPRCHHGFHVRCIDRWLSARPTCPTCRREPFSKTTAEEPPPPVAQLQVVVEAGQSVQV